MLRPVHSSPRDEASPQYLLAQHAARISKSEGDGCFQQLYKELDRHLGRPLPSIQQPEPVNGVETSPRNISNGIVNSKYHNRISKVRSQRLTRKHSYLLTNGSRHDPETARGLPQPLTFAQVDALLGLCKASPLVKHSQQATVLLERLSSYLPLIPYHAFIWSQEFHHLSPCPWHLVTANLTDAILQLGSHFPLLQHDANRELSRYLERCQNLLMELPQSHKDADFTPTQADNTRHLHETFTLVTSLLGFMEVAAVHAALWTPEQRHSVLLTLRELLTDEFLVAVEATVSMIGSTEDTKSSFAILASFEETYDLIKRPIGALTIKLAFASVVERCAALMVVPDPSVTKMEILSALSSSHSPTIQMANPVLCDIITDIAIQHLADLEEGLDYVQLGSVYHRKSTQALKASYLTSYLCCVVVDEEGADPDLLLSWLEKVIADPLQDIDEDLGCVALRCLACLAKGSQTIASNLSRSLPQMLIQRTLALKIGYTAAECLLCVLKLLSQDAVITTIWGLGNSLSAKTSEGEKAQVIVPNGVRHDSVPYDSTTSLLEDNRTASSLNRSLVIHAIITIAKGFGDTKIVALAISMLIQKVGKVTRAVDLAIITSSAELGSVSDATDFKALLRFYNRLIQEGTLGGRGDILDAVRDALGYLAENLKVGSPHHRFFAEYILQTLVSKGESAPNDTPVSTEAERIAEEMALLIHPLSLLVAKTASTDDVGEVERFASLQRDAWYNLVLQGFSLRSTIARRHINDLKILALYSEPLVPVDRESSVESPIELNMVLKRGSSSHNADKHRQEISELLPASASEIVHLDYSETIFLKAVHLVESLRAMSGDSTRIMGYFVEPRLQGTKLGRCMRALAQNTIENTIRMVTDVNEASMTARSLADQLSSILQSCCHRSPRVQEIAYVCADRVIEQVPAVLCQRGSLFTLLDLMSVMWSSCLESETTEYEWESALSTKSGVTVTLSDDFAFRSYTLRTFHRRSKDWVMKAINNSPLDVKGLLQTYLSNHTEDETFGHVSIGRSFALEMGGAIPQTDHRLSAIETNDISVNMASDFVAQYTGRQEYRFTDPTRLEELDLKNTLQLHDHLAKVSESGALPSRTDHAVIDAVRRQSNLHIQRALGDLESSISNGDTVDMRSLREVLRLTASLLCRLKGPQDQEIIRLFVKIPFDIFTKQAIKLGLSLWMGVMQENESLDSAIVTEVVFNWKQTVEKKKGIFDNQYMKDIHPDPFYVKMEYAPSDMESIHKQQHRVHDRLSPHFLVLQFISSHYMAQRLNGSFIELESLALLRSSLVILEDTPSHPLARELHFFIILFSLKVLRFSSYISAGAQRQYKDQILTAALAWFKNSPRYSFGGNRLQTKAETHLLADVANALQAVRNIGPENTKEASVRRKRQELLQILLANEQTRLLVWLFPLDHSKRHFFASGQHNQTPSETTLLGLLETAWNEDPSLAINISIRFQLETVKQAVRQWILKEPERAVHDPRGVQLMLGSSLPNDVGPQLHQLIKWAPVDPITSVTYLLPAYGNHPLIVQYAMASLESHSVEDVTFFYVPQIVQSLRYDVLGHIEHYIIKTAGFSQLFAHQIIWNIKANSYKDEDATDPDPMKPKLDKVMDRLIASFGGSDKDFYEREFAFFNEVTGVSGKLRPYLKASKPEKKQKIEEELRKIKIDPGVYLPSNPDGVVVNIDRTSGKPLQSHAKTPYMATFRIRKERSVDVDDGVPTSPTHSRKPTLDRQSSKASTTAEGATSQKPGVQTYEIWQSAIFKVGDDCRQDILALQMIACFRGIFANVGLPVYVFPYRVTATAPGCGVIDVLPRTISRDMLGREAVNGLYPWFVSRFGSESSPAFQVARANFVKSLAAYSIISFLMQFKDRHNGNIMFDEDGHILHIDFGFCFDISPGGVRFERAPFKLTKEMLSVLGGSTETQAFRWFEELCVKAFLSSRAYVAQLSSVVLCMLDSGLPCFKPVTIKHFQERFVLEKNEREAADFVRFLIRKSLDNKSTFVYDEFQLLTNGIPF